MQDLAFSIKQALPRLFSADINIRNSCIEEFSRTLSKESYNIVQANALDVEESSKEGISPSLLDRLKLDSERIQSMAAGLLKIAKFDDPLGEETFWLHPNGMQISKVRVPLGLLLVIYEARPNVTIDTLGLAIKTGNGAILRGSRQTKHTNKAIACALEPTLIKYGFRKCFAVLNDLPHEQVLELIALRELDLVIPRGGETLKKLVRDNAKVPVLGAGGGVCHIYVASSADLKSAAKIVFNAKVQRPSVCNALECLLIDESLLETSKIYELLQPCIQAGVEFRADARVRAKFSASTPAQDDDWGREYNDLVLAVKAVSGLDEAIDHINSYGTGHSDSIITEDDDQADQFVKLVDSGAVYVNASTRFTDGEEFGFGAEIGISTQKLHARGPIGPKELTTYKYIVRGKGQTRD